jgi:hypothetical protein
MSATKQVHETGASKGRRVRVGALVDLQRNCSTRNALGAVLGIALQSHTKGSKGSRYYDRKFAAP